MLLVLFISFLSLIYVPSNTHAAWSIETIDSGFVGEYSSTAIDSNDKVHISYYDAINGDIKYATNSSGTWEVCTVDSSGHVGAFSAIALDSNNKVHIAYYVNSGSIRYATNTSGVWVTSTVVDSTGGWLIGAKIDIATDSNDKVYICYWETINYDVKYATNASVAWITTVIESVGYSGRNPSIAVDATNNVHITYDSTNGISSFPLKYASNSTGSWTTQTVSSSGGNSSIAVDSNGKVHIIYSLYGLKYLTNVSGQWEGHTVGTLTSGNSSITVDTNNKVHVSYYDSVNKDLWHATDISGVWNETMVDTIGDVGEFNSIAIDSKNEVHIAYFDRTNGSLKHAIFIDADPPIATVDINNNAAYTNLTSVSLTLACTDYSGCTEMQFSNDNTNWSTTETYTTSKTWTLSSSDGTKTVYTKFKDNAGNWSTAYSDTITLDTTAPTTTASPASGTYNSIQSITLTCSDGTGSGCDKIYYTIDGTTPTTASTVYSTAISISATKTLKFFAKDLAGNSETVKSVTYTIDTTPPVFTSSSPASNSYINTASVGYTLSEQVASGNITFTQTGGTADPSSPQIYNLAAPDMMVGTHTVNTGLPLVNGAIYTVTFEATDLAGNVATPISGTNVTFDTTTASVTINSPASGSIVNNTTVTYALNEDISGGDVVFTRTSGNADSGSPLRHTLSGGDLTSGSHTINTGLSLVSGAVYSVGFENVTDKAGNATADVTNINVTYDSTAVAITATAPAASSVTATNAVGYTLSEAAQSGKVTFTRTGGNADAASPHVYTLAGADLYVGSHTVNTNLPLVDGAFYTVTFEATDMVGNPATTVSNAMVFYDSSYVTGFDMQPPQLLTPTSPNDLENNVHVNTTVNISFSEDIDASSLTTGTFALEGVNGTVSYDAASRTAIFKPSSNLKPKETYIARIYKGIKDLAGNATDYDYYWSFTTAGYQLNIITDGTEGGMVVSSPEGIDCKAIKPTSCPQGSSCLIITPPIENKCDRYFVQGDTVTLSATPDSGAIFNGWSGACSGTGPCTVAMDAAKSVTATFALDTTAPVTTASPAGGIYSSAKSIALKCSDGNGIGCDKIYYTTDGSTPTTASTVYSTSISISATKTLKFFAKDKAGNSEAVKSEVYTITTPDTTAPAFSSTSPSSDSFINTATVGYTLSEAVSTGKITFARTGGSADSASHIYNFTDSDKTVGTHSVNAGLSLINAGIYTVTFEATDLAGNAATVVSNTGIVYDNTSASVVLNFPSSNSRTNSISVSYTLNEEITSGDIVFSMTGGTTDGLSPRNHTLGASEKSSGSHTINTGVTLIDGAIYTVGFENVMDNAGNATASVSNTSITYDSTAVAITNTSPASNAIITNSSVGYTLSEAALSGKVMFTRSGGSADSGSPHVYTLSGADLYPGSHTVSTIPC